MFDNIYKKPTVWGQHAWVFLHCVTYSYPDKPTRLDKIHYKTFMNSLQFVLPCELCRKHYAEYLHHHPIDGFLESKDKFVHYVLKLHNYINTHFKKQKGISLEQGKNRFENFCIQQYMKDL